MIVADGHGGIVLIVPSETGSWSDLLNPFANRFASPDTTVRDATRLELHETHEQGETLARLSASFWDSERGRRRASGGPWGRRASKT